MVKIISRSLFFSFIAVLLMYFTKVVFKTENHISDIGGIQSFLGIFGTLYGIMAAFVVVEVWSEFNTTNSLIEKEALGLEKLYSLTLFFRDEKLNEKMKKAIKKYIEAVISSFKNLGEGARHIGSSNSFREIAGVIRNINFNDDHDRVTFGLVLDHYHTLAQVRVDRINQCLTRLPVLLRGFLYISSLFSLLFFITMPFNNIFYGFMSIGFLSFIIAMVFQLIEDLDNPFIGYWNITPEPFKRSLRHIEQDY